MPPFRSGADEARIRLRPVQRRAILPVSGLLVGCAKYDRPMTPMTLSEVDVTFDIRSDANGKDPDRYSPTLRRFHQLLWSKPLPDGTLFTLNDQYPSGYLTHSSPLGSFRLSSDMIIRTFRRVRRMQHVISAIPEHEQNAFSAQGCTVGGTTIFPGNRIDGGHTINQARGTNRDIEDRIDLTLECIRRMYAGESSPMSRVLERYADFFSLFQSFRGYVDFFHFQDLVTRDYREVRFFTRWDDFTSPALPNEVTTYIEYRDHTLKFLTGRNSRIHAWATHAS